MARLKHTQIEYGTNIAFEDSLQDEFERQLAKMEITADVDQMTGAVDNMLNAMVDGFGVWSNAIAPITAEHWAGGTVVASKQLLDGRTSIMSVSVPNSVLSHYYRIHGKTFPSYIGYRKTKSGALRNDIHAVRTGLASFDVGNILQYSIAIGAITKKQTGKSYLRMGQEIKAKDLERAFVRLQ